MSSEIASLYASIGADTGPLDRAAAHSKGVLSGLGGFMSNAFSTALGIGIAAITSTATKVIGGFVDDAMKSAMGFEQTMNVLQSVTSATADEMTALSAKAKQLGADTTLPGTSAIQAAEGMLELSKAGLSVAQSMEAARGTIQLARAAQVSEAEAATITANALNAFKLSGDKATMVADLLAASANASSGEIIDMAYALRASSSVAASAGQSIGDTVTAISLLANAGIQGSDAGTSLKTMLMRLQAPTDTAKATLDQLGISVYDASGNMKSMRDIITQFSNATQGLTQEQRAQALTTIFGSDAIRAANIILTQGTSAWDSMSTAVNKAGVAADVAGAQNKGLKGAMDGLQSTVETLGLAFAEPLLQPLDSAVRKFTDFIGSPAVSAVIAKFGADIGVFIGRAVDWVIANFPLILSTIGNVVDGLVMFVTGTLVPLFTNTLVPAFQAVVAWVQEKFPGVRDTVLEVFGVISTFFTGTLIPIIDTYVIPAFLSLVQTAKDNLPQIQSTMATVFGAVVEFITGTVIPLFNDKLIPAFNDVVAWVQANWPTIWGKISEVFNGVMGFITGTVVPFFETTVLPVFNDVVAWVQTNWPIISAKVSEVFNAIIGFITGTVVPFFETKIVPAFETVKGWIEKNWPGIRDTVVGAFEKAIAFVKSDVIPFFETKIVPAFETVKTWVETNWPKIQSAIGDAVKEIEKFYHEHIEPGVTFVVEQFQKVKDWIDKNWGLIQKTIETVTGAIKKLFENGGDEFGINTLGNIFETVFGTIKNVVGTALDIILGLLKVGMQLITGDTKGAGETLKNVFADIFWGAASIVAGVVNVIGEIFRGLAPLMIDIGVTINKAFFNTFKNIYDGAQSLMPILRLFQPMVASALDASFSAEGVADYGRRLNEAGQTLKDMLGTQKVDVLASLGITKEGLYNLLGVTTTQQNQGNTGNYIVNGPGGQNGIQPNYGNNTYNIYTTDDPQAITDAIARENRLQQALSAVR